MSVDKSQLDSLRIERPREEVRAPRRRPVLAFLLGALTLPVVASGYVTARRQSTVSSKVTGRIVNVNIEEGMHVQAGQELARLDDAIASERPSRISRSTGTAARR